MLIVCFSNHYNNLNQEHGLTCFILKLCLKMYCFLSKHQLLHPVHLRLCLCFRKEKTASEREKNVASQMVPQGSARTFEEEKDNAIWKEGFILSFLCLKNTLLTIVKLGGHKHFISMAERNLRALMTIFLNILPKALVKSPINCIANRNGFFLAKYSVIVVKLISFYNKNKALLH